MLKPRFAGIRAPPCCLELREGRDRDAGVWRTGSSRKQPSPLLQRREQPALGQPDPLICWSRRCSTCGPITTTSSHCCCCSTSSRAGAVPVPDALEARRVPHASAARVLMSLPGEGAEEARGRTERRRKAIKGSPPVARAARVMGASEVSPPGDKAWPGLTWFEGTGRLTRCREPCPVSPKLRLQVLGSTGAPRSPPRGGGPRAAPVPGEAEPAQWVVPSRKPGRGWRGSGIAAFFFSNPIINSHQA